MKTYQQMEGDLALANESLGLLQRAKRKTFHLHLNQRSAKDEHSRREKISQIKLVVGVIGMTFLLCVLWLVIVFTLYQVVRVAL